MLTWDELLKRGEGVGMAEASGDESKNNTALLDSSSGDDLDKVLQARMAEQKPGHCCALIYTSGTTGQPKVNTLHGDCLVPAQ